MSRRWGTVSAVVAFSLSSVVALNAVNVVRAGAAHTVVPRSNSGVGHHDRSRALARPTSVQPYPGSTLAGQGAWRAAGRLVHGVPAVYTTTLRLPGPTTVVAGLAWMDTSLLRARLYSGSLSPGGLFWKYTAPVSPGAARSLVVAFNGGFLLKASNGGYLSSGCFTTCRIYIYGIIIYISIIYLVT